MEPIAMGEAQKNLQQLADASLEALDRFRIVDIQLVERVHHAVGKHQ